MCTDHNNCLPVAIGVGSQFRMLLYCFLCTHVVYLYMYVAIESYVEQAKRKKAIVTQQTKKKIIDACEQIMVKICYY